MSASRDTQSSAKDKEARSKETSAGKLRYVRKGCFREFSDEAIAKALRTAFVARFIVLREGRRSRAHRAIEQMSWEEEATASDLYEKFRQAFVNNGDKLEPVDRDLNRALSHAEKSVEYFLDQYLERDCRNFQDALTDYSRSNKLLFGEDSEEVPRSGGWRLPKL